MTPALACRIGILLVVCTSGRVGAQDAITLVEKFEPGNVSKVEVAVKLTGKLAVPTEKGKAPQLVPLAGTSRITYEERVLPPDDPAMLKAVRVYREVEFVRALGDATQDAGIRPSVRRMVILKSEGRRAPFSPDGPLTWARSMLSAPTYSTPQRSQACSRPARSRRGRRGRRRRPQLLNSPTWRRSRPVKSMSNSSA